MTFYLNNRTVQHMLHVTCIKPRIVLNRLKNEGQKLSSSVTDVSKAINSKSRSIFRYSLEKVNNICYTGDTNIIPENVGKIFPELFRFPVSVLNARKAEIIPENVENRNPELFWFLSLFRNYIVRNYISNPCIICLVNFYDKTELIAQLLLSVWYIGLNWGWQGPQNDFAKGLVGN